MRKYREIAVTYLKAQLVWRADVIFNMIFTIGKIIFARILWGAIFEGKEMVAGFTYHGMMSYYIISSFLSQIEMSGGISREISDRIRNGTFSRYMVIPVKIDRYFLAMEAGVVAFYMVFDLFAAGIWIFLFRIQFEFTGELLMIAGAFMMILLGLVFMVQLNYYLGLLTLKFQEIGTFLMIKDNLAAFVTGSMIPLVLLPAEIVAVMRVFPFYYVTYLPAMLLIGRCREEMAAGLLVLSGWCILMELINRRTYEAYRLKFDGVGI